MSGFTASAVIVAGGTGSRMGRPKQVLALGGKPVVVRSILAFKACACVKEIIVVTPLENRPIISQFVHDVIFVDPGDTRLASVQNGVAQVNAQADVVAVHDGARPLVNPKHVVDALQSAFDNGAAVLAVPVKDRRHDRRRFAPLHEEVEGGGGVRRRRLVEAEDEAVACRVHRPRIRSAGLDRSEGVRAILGAPRTCADTPPCTPDVRPRVRRPQNRRR